MVRCWPGTFPSPWHCSLNHKLSPPWACGPLITVCRASSFPEGAGASPPARLWWRSEPGTAVRAGLRAPCRWDCSVRELGSRKPESGFPGRPSPMDQLPTAGRPLATDPHTFMVSQFASGPGASRPLQTAGAGVPQAVFSPEAHLGVVCFRDGSGGGRFISCGCRAARLADLLTMAAYVVESARCPQNESAQSWKI